MTRDEWQKALNARSRFAVNPRVIVVMQEFATGSNVVRCACSRENSGGNEEKEELEVPEFWN